MNLTYRVDLSGPGLRLRTVCIDPSTHLLSWLAQNGGSYTTAVIRRQNGVRLSRNYTLYLRPMSGPWVTSEAFNNPSTGPRPGDVIHANGFDHAQGPAGTVRRVKRHDTDTGSYYVITDGGARRWVAQQDGKWVDQGAYL